MRRASMNMSDRHGASKGVGAAAIGFVTTQIEQGSDHRRNKRLSYTSLDQEATDMTANTETPLTQAAGCLVESRSLAEIRRVAANRLGISDEDYKVRLAAAKMIGGFLVRDKGSVELERGSVYGAVILIPQVARTAGWPRFFVSMMVRSYLFLFVNFAVQGGLLYMIAKEETVMDLFSGQMYLCDFGAWVKDCPGQPWCVGPAGTQITPPRMYSWAQWSMRTFVRQSLEALFPDRIADIREKVDPGEYGLESYSCRLLSCFIFMMSVMSELYLNFRMIRLICAVPTVNEPWIELNENDDVHTWLDAAEIKVAGMSAAWKILNILVVFIPKMLLWSITATSGVTFLMETGSIEDIIVNSVALTFVLNIDEMFFELMSDSAKVMLECHAELKFYSEEHEENLPEELIMEQYSTQQAVRHWGLADTLSLFPSKLLAVFILTFIFVLNYYIERCEYGGNFHWHSKTMYLPKSIQFPILSAFAGSIWPTPSLDKPFWTMPRAQLHSG